MKVGEIAKCLEARLPAAWSEDWDNVGLMVGDPDWEVTRIGVALDATEESVRAAMTQGCGMLVVHHPAIFRPLQRVVTPSPVSDMVCAAVRNNIAVYSCHTNWDSSPDGVNVVLAGLLGLQDVVPIMPPHDGAWGMGAIGHLREPATLRGIARAAKASWGLSTLLAYGDDDTPLSCVALCGGAGGDFLQTTLDRGADVYITADVSYHYLLHANLSGGHLIVANHGEMERASLPALCALIGEATSLDVRLLAASGWTPFVI